MNNDRYAYEEAEKVLDAYAASRPRPTFFQRAYRMFKFYLHGVACMDFADGEHSAEEAMAFAWEDAEVAFKGYGEPGITGCVIAMWSTLPTKEYNNFERVIHQAFSKASKATGNDVQRRFLAQWRMGPVRRPEQGFASPPVDPTYYPYPRDFTDKKEIEQADNQTKKWLRRAESTVITNAITNIDDEE